MLVQKNTRMFFTEHRNVQDGVVIPEEGIALVYVKQGNETVVRPSTGAAGEVFAGFSMSRNSPPSFIPHVIEGRVSASLLLELPRIPVSGQILVKLGNTVATIVANAPAASGEVQLSANNLAFHADDEGKKVFVQFIYEPTLAEARTILGDMPIGGLPTSHQGIIGLAVRGDIATTWYDASVDWSGVINPTLGVDGRLTVGGTGVKLTNVVVQSAPTAEAGSFGALIVNIR